MRKNLKEISKELSIDLNENLEWFERECRFVRDGSHISGFATYEYICQTLDISKANFGTGNNNLIAWVGNVCLQDIYSVNPNQAVSIYKYLKPSEQQIFNNLVKDLLLDFN